MEKIHKDQLLAWIRSGKESRDKAISVLYHNPKLKEDVKTIIFKMGGQSEDVKSIYNQMLMQFVKSAVRNQDLSITGDLNGYLVGVAKYLWFGELKKRKTHLTSDLESLVDLSSDIQLEETVIKEEKYHLLRELLSTLGEKCKEVLMHWAHGYKMDQIAEMMAYKSSDMAKKKKYNCMKRLLLYVEQNPQVKEALR